MTVLLISCFALSLILSVYLVVALLKPEIFG